MMNRKASFEFMHERGSFGGSTAKSAPLMHKVEKRAEEKGKKILLPIVAVGNSCAALLVLGGATFGLQAAFAAPRSGTRRNTWNAAALGREESLGHALKSHLAVRVLRAPLGGRDHDAARPVDQSHAGLHLVAMLPARPAGNKKFNAAITLQ